jgi:hypothetical protein
MAAKKLSDKINYSVLENLFADGAGEGGAGGAGGGAAAGGPAGLRAGLGCPAAGAPGAGRA